MNTQAGIIERLAASRAPRAVVLVRLMVGLVFLEEGIQKFLFPELLGAGRFARIGIPWPEAMGPFVGTVEIVCGTLLLLGLLFLLIAGAGAWSLDAWPRRGGPPTPTPKDSA